MLARRAQDQTAQLLAAKQLLNESYNPQTPGKFDSDLKLYKTPFSFSAIQHNSISPHKKSPYCRIKSNQFSSMISDSPSPQPVRKIKMDNHFDGNFESCVNTPDQERGLFFSQQILNGGQHQKSPKLVAQVRTPMKNRVHSPCGKEDQDMPDEKATS